MFCFVFLIRVMCGCSETKVKGAVLPWPRSLFRAGFSCWQGALQKVWLLWKHSYQAALLLPRGQTVTTCMTQLSPAWLMCHRPVWTVIHVNHIKTHQNLHVYLGPLNVVDARSFHSHKVTAYSMFLTLTGWNFWLKKRKKEKKRTWNNWFQRSGKVCFMSCKWIHLSRKISPKQMWEKKSVKMPSDILPVYPRVNKACFTLYENQNLV